MFKVLLLQALLFQLLLLKPLQEPLSQALLSLPPNPRQILPVAIPRPSLKVRLVLLPAQAPRRITFMRFNRTSNLQWMTSLNYDPVSLSESFMSTMTAG
jgi:hypothetical protein